MPCCSKKIELFTVGQKIQIKTKELFIAEKLLNKKHCVVFRFRKTGVHLDLGYLMVEIVYLHHHE